jgi:hypothetical protein
MDRHPSSLHPAHPVLHQLAPCLPVRDAADLRMRVLNFHASMNACPTCWRVYFEVHARAMEREMN